MREILLACLLALAAREGAGARAADWGFDATAGTAYDDNLSNGFEEADRNGAGSLTLDLDASVYPDRPPQVVVDQIDKEFVPYVTPVRAGSGDPGYR
jgi:hypothetical protein